VITTYPFRLQRQTRTNIEHAPRVSRLKGPELNKALIVILAAVTLDAVGIGLIFPILPRLLEDVTHTHEVTALIGIMLALYSAMLGVLSDR
jgi:hypothetical protein